MTILAVFSETPLKRNLIIMLTTHFDPAYFTLKMVDLVTPISVQFDPAYFTLKMVDLATPKFCLNLEPQNLGGAKSTIFKAK